MPFDLRMHSTLPQTSTTPLARQNEDQRPGQPAPGQPVPGPRGPGERRGELRPGCNQPVPPHPGPLTVQLCLHAVLLKSLTALTACMWGCYMSFVWRILEITLVLKLQRGLQ